MPRLTRAHLPLATQVPIDTWEGPRPDQAINGLDEALHWIEGMAANVVIFRDDAASYESGSAKDAAGQILRNAYRLLDQLGQSGFPRRVTDSKSLNQLENYILEVLAWVRARIASPDKVNARPAWPTPPKTGAALTKAMSPKEIGNKLGIHRDTVLNRLKDGRLPAIRLSDRLYQIPLSCLPATPE